MPVEMHAKLSASISKRWMQVKDPNGKALRGCPGSITLSARVIQDQKSNMAADTGTAAHYIGEQCLLKAQTPEDFVKGHPKDYIIVEGSEPGKVVKIPITEKMIEDVGLYTNTIWSDVEHYESELGIESQIFVEEEFSLNWIFEQEDYDKVAEFMVESDLYPDIEDEFDAEELVESWLQMFGTNDCSVVYPGKALFIYDYKNGRWPVPAENNTQFLYYAVGAAQAHNWDFEFIEMLAIQPNSMDEEKIPRWRITKNELLQWVPVFKEAALKTILEPNNFCSGEHCHFCPAKGQCQQEADDAMAAAKIDFDDDFSENEEGSYEVNLSPIGSLSYTDMKKVLDNADSIINFVKAVQCASKELLEHGDSTAREKLNYKLVEKPKNRKVHASDEEIIEYATEELFLDVADITQKLPKYGKLLPMSKLENVLGKDNMKQFISRPEPDIIMVPANDKREEIVLNPGDDFIDCEDDEL